MISYIKGSVLAINAESAIIVNNGVGYELFLSGGAFALAQSHPSDVELFTYLQVKEDGLTLYGFASLKEKQLFLDLISVSGVGPKLAIGVLNGMPWEDVAKAVAMADVKALSSIKGLGKKTAEKIVLELHGKISAQDLLAAEGELSAGNVKAAAPKLSVADEEAVSALMNLGFTRGESQTAVAKAREKGASSVEEIIRLSLANM